MIKVEMSEHYCVDVLRGQPDRLESSQQPAGNKTQGLLVGVHVLGPDSSVYQDVLAG